MKHTALGINGKVNYQPAFLVEDKEVLEKPLATEIQGGLEGVAGKIRWALKRPDERMQANGKGKPIPKTGKKPGGRTSGALKKVPKPIKRPPPKR